MAGWEVERVLQEPVAAGLAYMHSQNADIADEAEPVIVFDFGGGTLDVTAINMSDGTLEVLQTEGDSQLGGQDID